MEAVNRKRVTSPTSGSRLTRRWNHLLTPRISLGKLAASVRVADGSAQTGETHVYVCSRHGEFVLAPDGHLRGRTGHVCLSDKPPSA
jgi:hypothetical protein